MQGGGVSMDKAKVQANEQAKKDKKNDRHREVGQ